MHAAIWEQAIPMSAEDCSQLYHWALRFLTLHAEQGILCWHLSFRSVTDIPSPLRGPLSVPPFALVLKILSGAACRMECLTLLLRQESLALGAIHDSGNHWLLSNSPLS